MTPKKLRLASPTELSIEWDDGHTGRHTLRTLRKYCPCAECKQSVEMEDGRTMLPILKPGQYELRSIEVVGNYAVQLVWGDGHKTGIYTYDHLRQVCECEGCLKITAE
ncbi:MAG TPA: DUF971 domain-containing protein [Bacteroidota bacterium]|nr:DUF971 domain-containing protein [Bacteroidota bacterium]